MKMYLLMWLLIAWVLTLSVTLDLPAKAQSTTDSPATNASDAPITYSSGPSPTVDEAKRWLIEKINKYGGYARYYHAKDGNDDRMYANSWKNTNVSFDGSIISYTLTTSHTSHYNGKEITTTRQYTLDLGQIKPNTFELNEEPITVDDRLSIDPETAYGIQCAYIKDTPHPCWFNVEFTDKEMAQRVVNALNYLSQHVDHPTPKPEPF